MDTPVEMTSGGDGYQYDIAKPPYIKRPFHLPDVPTPGFAWLAYMPSELRKWLVWSPSSTKDYQVLLLYSGKSDAGSLKTSLAATGCRAEMLEVDILGSPPRDMLAPEPYSSL